jgi:hypothetical protein
MTPYYMYSIETRTTVPSHKGKKYTQAQLVSNKPIRVELTLKQKCGTINEARKQLNNIKSNPPSYSVMINSSIKKLTEQLLTSTS